MNGSVGRMFVGFILMRVRHSGAASAGEGSIHSVSGSRKSLSPYGGIRSFSSRFGENRTTSFFCFFNFFLLTRRKSSENTEIIRNRRSILLLGLYLIYLKFWVLVISLLLTSAKSYILDWFGVLSVKQAVPLLFVSGKSLSCWIPYFVLFCC